MGGSKKRFAYDFNNIFDRDFEKGIDGFKLEINEFGKCFETKEFKEGTSAFLNKRKPDFN